jgi:amidase
MSASLSRRSAVELRDLIRNREVTPLEVLEAHLSAIARNTIRSSMQSSRSLKTRRALQPRAAGAAVTAGEPLGPLHGLPVVIKDVTLTAGIRTTFGSPLFKDFVPEEDAAAVARLRKAGAIVLGKTNTPEFATGANTVNELFGATRNPWNPD